MTRSKALTTAACLLALVAAGCESKQQTGAVLGAVAGGILGDRIGGGIVGLAAGAVIGGLLGSEIGKSLDREDVKRANDANQRAMEQNRTGQAAAWKNPDSGNSGSVTPTTNAYASNDGTVCRDFQQTVSASGKTESGTGRACKQPDGSWKVIN